jgi:phosphatidylserine/phosphatidylglycerophosphate/cardiolipin synthase-like enzyme
MRDLIARVCTFVLLGTLLAAGCAEPYGTNAEAASSSRRRAGSDEISSRAECGSGSPTRTAASVRAASVEDNIEVYFSPEGGATEAIVAEIARAKRSVRVQAFAFTSQPIAEAVADARKRGLDVTVTLDENRTMEKASIGRWLWDQGVPVFVDNQHSNAHSKIIICDERTVITGSFNFTKSAEINNAENLLVIRNKPKLTKAYQLNFDRHLVHSVPYHKWLAENGDARP